LRGVTTPRRRISGGQTLPESFSRVVKPRRGHARRVATCAPLKLCACSS
jgi:hypothetical protein